MCSSTLAEYIDEDFRYAQYELIEDEEHYSG